MLHICWENRSNENPPTLKYFRRIICKMSFEIRHFPISIIHENEALFIQFLSVILFCKFFLTFCNHLKYMMPKTEYCTGKNFLLLQYVLRWWQESEKKGEIKVSLVYDRILGACISPVKISPLFLSKHQLIFLLNLFSPFKL